MNKRGFIRALSLGSGTLFSLPAKDRFGASAPGDVVMREHGFTAENVCKRALAVLG